MVVDVRRRLAEMYQADGDHAVSPSADQTWAQAAASLLAGVDDADQRAHLRFVFEEREAVAEVDGNLTRHEAERIAYEQLREAMTHSQH